MIKQILSTLGFLLAVTGMLVSAATGDFFMIICCGVLSLSFAIFMARDAICEELKTKEDK